MFGIERCLGKQSLVPLNVCNDSSAGNKVVFFHYFFVLEGLKPLAAGVAVINHGLIAAVLPGQITHNRLHLTREFVTRVERHTYQNLRRR